MPEDYRYPVPTDSIFNDVDQYVPLLLAAIDDYMDYPNVWPEGQENDALGYMEDVKAWIQELTQTMFTPIGAITEYIGTDAPEGWLKCDGSTHNQADYPALAEKLPASLKDDVNGTFATPDMRGRMPVGADTEYFQFATTGGEMSHALSVDELPAHTHVQNPHNHSQNAHNHTQNSHTHNTQPHTHIQNSHTHGQEAHGHTVESRQSATGLGTGALAASNGIPTHLAPTTQVSPAIFGATATNQNATVSVDSATATNQQTTATNNPTTATNQNTGGNVAHNNMPPYLVVHYIIRAR